jgi:hypothetical protein
MAIHNMPKTLFPGGIRTRDLQFFEANAMTTIPCRHWQGANPTANASCCM